MELLTTWEDDNGSEWPIRVSFYYTPAERETLEYPGCSEALDIDRVERLEEVSLDEFQWRDFDGESASEAAHWIQEGWEMLINDYEESRATAADHDYERRREMKHEH